MNNTVLLAQCRIRAVSKHGQCRLLPWDLCLVHKNCHQLWWVGQWYHLGVPLVTPPSPNSGRPSGLETSKPHGGQGSANLSLACGICRCACGHLVRFPARGTEEPKVDGSGRQGARPLGTAGVAALRKGTDQMGKGRACSVPPARSAGHNYLSV